MPEKNPVVRLFSSSSLSSSLSLLPVLSVYLILIVFLSVADFSIVFGAAFSDDITVAMIKNDMKKMTEHLEKNPQQKNQKDK
jgi:7-keto-8-aminopelargonate synthetase-like enzyme